MRLWIIVSLALTALTCQAAPSRAAECPDQTQNGLNACAAAAYHKADDALNAAYREITRRLKDDADTTKLLVQSQRAWIAFRDAECQFSSSAVIGGSIHPMIEAMCLEAQTLQRLKALKSYLACQEGDMSCPVPAN